MVPLSQLLAKIGIPNSVFSTLSEEDRVSFQTPFTLQITFAKLPSAENLGNFFYFLYNKLNYLFNYLDYSIKTSALEKLSFADIQNYIQLIYCTPFLWKKGGTLFTICEQWDLATKLNFRDNVIYLPAIPKSKNVIQKDLQFLKKFLGSFGLENIQFKAKTTLTSSRRPSEKKPIILNLKKKVTSPIKSFSPPNWKEKKLIEFGIHTKFSTLDGISSPTEYAREALSKNYSTLVITEHYNVQSFPEFFQVTNPNLRFIYGCELEVLEDDFPPYIFNHSPYHLKEIVQQPIENLVYAVFDLETTGFFSEYNEIIEIGYVIWKNGGILPEEKKEYLVCPKTPISPELFRAWYTDINPQELQNAPCMEKILPLVKEHWEKQGVQLLVAHNARNFDFSFLNKAWKKQFGKELLYPIVDTLPLSWLVLSERRSYSLEKLSQIPGKNRLKQSHRALADSESLADLLSKLIKNLKEEKGISEWRKVKELLKDNTFFPNRGYKIKVLARNQKGLNSLYQLITLSHTKRFFRNPRIFRADLLKHRANLIIGASGGKESEIFSLFSSFSSEAKKKERMKFYDYVEVNAPSTFRHLWLNGQITEKGLKDILQKTIEVAKLFNIPVVASHNVHYCKPEQKIIKEILVANEGMNGSKHNLYEIATLNGKEDRFAFLPEQHLRKVEEIVKDWSFLNDADLMEEIIFSNPLKVVNKIEKVVISDEQIKYPSFSQAEHELENAFFGKAKEIFGEKLPWQVQERIDKEWEIIKKNYLSIYWLAYKVVQKTHADKQIIGSRGSVGCSFIAFLCQITDLNSLPPYKFCQQCKYFLPYLSAKKIFSCYDHTDKENCPQCQNPLKIEGHDLPMETFFGWNGEKTPDIDLNFSGEYQKTAHDYVRELVGKDYVYRVGTINKLSQQTSEIFFREYKKLRKNLNPQSNLYLNNELETIEQLKGIKRTTGQHPGGLLVIPQEIDIYDYTPLNNPADNPSSEWLTTHFEYSFLAKLFLKLDILGHDEPTVLQKLFEITKKDPTTIKFSDEKVMEIFTKGDTLGIPEFGTDFVKKNFLNFLKPTKFSQLVQISGFSHGTNVWTQNQQTIWKERNLSLEELIACREDIWTFLESWGLEKKDAFVASEYIRKGNWEKLSKPIKITIREKLGIGEKFLLEESNKLLAIQNKINIKTSETDNSNEKSNKVEPLEKLLLQRKRTIQVVEKAFLEDPSKKNLLPKDWKKQIQTINRGEIYYNILSKIQYIFPKPHAISYTITAWRTAYYKNYYPHDFYSVLLTYHASVYDIWLMTFDTAAITFRLKRLLQTLVIAKNSEKELISIIKVLQQLIKEKNSALKSLFFETAEEINVEKKQKIQRLQAIDIEKALFELKNNLFVMLENQEPKGIITIAKFFQSLKITEKEVRTKLNEFVWEEDKKTKFLKEVNKRVNFRDWKLTMKEKSLLYTLKIILEMETKGFIFARGIDFNNSEIKNFKIKSNKIFIPFTAVAGIGDKVAEKIIAYRQEKGQIVNWKEELEGLLNKNHFEQLENLEKYKLILK